MKRVTSLSLSAIGLLALLPASLAHASSSWGAIWYTSSTNHSYIWNFPSKTDAIIYIRDTYGDDAQRVVYPSGWCGALISYKDYSGQGWLSFGTGQGKRDAAVDDAADSSRLRREGQYTLLEAQCQD